jgi:iron(III) transport system ATP-binding protein
MSRLEVVEIRKRYVGAKEEAVQAMSFCLEAGQNVALVGESGSGKTTFLRMLAGFEIPDGGMIRFGEEIWSDATTFLPPEKRRIGMLFQDYALFPHLTVAQNIAFGLHHLPKAERPAIVKRALEQVRLPELSERYPHQISGGQRQRIALARALAPEPRILLLDEPFSHLDELVKADLRDEIYDLLTSLGIATLSVIHDTRDALRCADEIAILQKGRLLQRGTPEDLYLRPADPYIARFFGLANLLPATLQDNVLQTPLGLFPRPPHLSAHNDAQGWVCLRPEHLSLSLAENAEKTEEMALVLDGIVESCHFLGAQREIRVRLFSATSEEMPIFRIHTPASICLNRKQPVRLRAPMDRLIWIAATT